MTFLFRDKISMSKSICIVSVEKTVMFKNGMKYYFPFFLLVLITSCTKAPNTFSNQTFPNKVGNQWVYRYKDGYTNGDQYIYVDIVGITTLQGQTATIWTSTLQDALNRKYLIDSSYVVVDNNKAVFYTPPCLICTPQPLYEKRRYVFPLQIGNVWFSDKFFGDTTKVLNEKSLTVPAGTFENTFQLSKTIGYVTNSFTRDSIWLTPNIGMTKYYQDEYSLGPIPGNGTWELTNYILK